MTTIKAILAAFLGGVLGFAAVGFGAAVALGSAPGHHDGGPEMAGLFGFGPIGGIAGAILGIGLSLRFWGGSAKWGGRLMIASGILAVATGILLAIVVSPDRGPSYSYVIEFELEYPEAILAAVDIPSSNAMWGAAGATSDDKPISQFFEKKCSADTCVVNGSIAALGPMSDFRVAALIGQRKYRYPLDLPAVVAGPMDWSPWRSGDGARVRWRIVKRQ
jgi:hypothetical protein